MNLKTYLAHMSQSDFARLIGVSPGLVYQWVTGIRPISPKQCVAIERATRGQVTRRDLRPDDYALLWPDLAQAPPAVEASPGRGRKA